MGCDIHLFAEWKRVDGVWEPAGDEGEYYSDRDYRIFAHLAGVRNRHGIEPIDEPRGLPKDVSFTVLQALDFDRHSHSWLTLAELMAHDWPDDVSFFREQTIFDLNNQLLRGTGLTPDDVRIVFAFDN